MAASTTRAPVGLRFEALDAVAQRVLEDVVGQHHREAVAVDEPFGEAERLGDAAGVRLVRVEETVDAPLLAVAEQPEELAGVEAARHDHHLVDAGLDERLDRVVDHRAIEDRQEVLVGDAGQRVEPTPGAACEDHTLHGRTVWRGTGVGVGSAARSPLGVVRCGCELS